MDHGMKPRKMMAGAGMDCCAKPIKGAVNQPKMTPAGPIKNSVAYRPTNQGCEKIKGAVTAPHRY